MPKRKPRRKPQERFDAEPTIPPTEAQLANGDYAAYHLPNPDGGNRVARVYLNRGGTPVDRWKSKERLSSSQLRAIEHCQALWRRAGINPTVTARYGERIAASGSAELATRDWIEAREDLWRIIDHFPGALKTYWRVFESVCRFDIPAGVAGGELSKSNRTADARAHQVVCFVADVIAMKERL